MMYTWGKSNGVVAKQGWASLAEINTPVVILIDDQNIMLVVIFLGALNTSPWPKNN